ncbi:sortase family protein [Aeromicrobium marinum DSM 15272]|uniref:Sortase family protein n=1 Tax=Aeromicrobium marinum DSM 15272 TaxID=585531 RepID=E2SB12_9ACTN|nr:class F sortase [Aeromicrobium marinum]EFQ83558.1 sortase family protein [Aeromicrobium marinum DSM 15272]
MPELPRLAGLVLLAALLTGCGGQDVVVSPSPPAAPSAEPSPAAAEPPAAPADPARVVVPSIGIDEELIDLGIDASNGELEVPQDYDRVGWFTGGGRPGDFLPTVMAGHVDSRTGPAVFARLAEVQVGEQVTVFDERGTEFTYVVYEVKDVPQDANFPTDEVYGAALADEIRLITCIGDYDRSIGRYTENRVVFAKAV